MTSHPEVLWAQRSSATEDARNIIYLTVNLPDINESTLEYSLTSTGVSFKCIAGNASKGIEERKYAFSFDLYAEVVPEESTKRLSSRSLNLILRKEEKKAEYWPRLTKEKIKTPFIKTDFSKWVDEDEQDSNAGGFDDDFDGMGDMGSMGGGMGGMDFEKMMKDMDNSQDKPTGDDNDSEDDAPPPLES